MKISRSLLFVTLGLAACTAWAELLPPPLPSTSPLQLLQTRVERVVERGYDHPVAALAEIDTLATQDDLPPGAAQSFELARGLIAAGAARGNDAGATTQAALAALQARAANEPLAAADALLVQAVAALTQDRADAAAEHARAALTIYNRLCESATPAPACNARALLRTHELLSRCAAGQGQVDAAMRHAQAALELARGTEDIRLQARAMAVVADIKATQGEHDAARRQLADADRMARLDGDALTMARLKMVETRISERRGDPMAARRAAEQGLVWAHQADSARLTGRLLTNLSDSYLKAGQAREALVAVERALPEVRRFGERHTERVLLANRALARVALHMGRSARAEVDTVIAVFAASGGDAELAIALREFGDALADAGDLSGALELFHRERKLVAETMAQNRKATLSSLSGRFDREAQQRDIELRSRENALRAADLANHASAQRLWIAGAVTAALAALVVAMLYGRVRSINRRLAHNQATLRVQSEQDALTGLANRRRLHTLASEQGVNERFHGALLLVDIDHFKRINDEHGHAGGDVVLVEVARRLSEAVRDGDVVVRWGGEEFLIFAPAVGAEQVGALALRVLQAVGERPVQVGKLKVAVTVSLGFGSFPLPPHRLPVTLERAVNLTDMALYTAKNQGRNRAVGIQAVTADTSAGMAAVEADFDLAWQQGRVVLDRIVGPAQPRRAEAVPA